MTGNQAHQRVWYSARAIFDLGLARVRGGENGTVVYRIPRDDGDIVHKIPIGPFVSAIYYVSHLLEGTQKMRPLGILKGKTHTALMAKLGREGEEEPRRKLLGGYVPRGDGYDFVPPRDFQRSAG